MAGPARAQYTRELFLRWRQRRVAAGAPTLGSIVRSSSDVARLFGFLKKEPKEHLYAIHIDGGNRVIGLELVGLGGLGQAPCDVADIFRAALLSGARALVLCHQHPGGIPNPSAQDRELTRQVADAARLLGIRLLDHVIIGARDSYSFADHGLLDTIITGPQRRPNRRGTHEANE